ncbi:MAG: FAD-dependent monooxygenase [Terracidiphilus sp.]
MTSSSRATGHLVIGGGLAGSMVGMRLAAAGREVTVLERERAAHHKVCGEFLSHEAVEYLHQLGIDPLALGAAPIRYTRLSVKRRVVEAALPFTALSLSRHILDEAILARAAQSGCHVQRGAFVESLTSRDNMWHAELREGNSWSAPTVFLANGKHDLRGLNREPCAQADLVGFKMHMRLSPSQTNALREFMELFLFPGGYGGLSLVEEDTANFCLVVRRSALRKIGGWTELLTSLQDENPHLAQRLSGSTALWDRPLAVSSIPYGYLASRPNGLWCVGDQAAVIPSFTGDGMSIALHSAALAARMYLAHESAEQYFRELHTHLSRRMTLATTLSRTMVTSLGRTMVPFGLSLVPQAIRWIASWTRIPKQAMVPRPTAMRDMPASRIPLRS